jgi:hypothetical protein
MKLKTIILTLTLSAPVLFASEVFAQDQPVLSNEEFVRMDSVQSAKKAAVIQKEQDEDRLTTAKDEKRKTKAKAKEAARVEREASDAARESRNALRTEKKAQKARKHADAQAKKASRARIKSEKN